MLIAVAPQVQHALTLQEDLVRLHASLHGPRTEVPELLALRLAGTNGCAQVPQRQGIADGRQALVLQCHILYIYTYSDSP